MTLGGEHGSRCLDKEAKSHTGSGRASPQPGSLSLKLALVTTEPYCLSRSYRPKGLVLGSHLFPGPLAGHYPARPPSLSVHRDRTLAARLHFTSTMKCSKWKRCCILSQSILEPVRVLSPDSWQKFTLLIMRQCPQGSAFRTYACPSTGTNVNRGLVALLGREGDPLCFTQRWDRACSLPPSEGGVWDLHPAFQTARKSRVRTSCVTDEQLNLGPKTSSHRSIQG